MSVRLLVVAAAATAGTATAVFGDSGPVARPELIEPLGERVARWMSGPEPACRETMARLGGVGGVVPELAGPDVGAWRGRPLGEVAAGDPDGLAGWLTDPSTVPPGGESLEALVTGVGDWLDGVGWPEGRTVAVVTPLTARGLVVAALALPPAAIFRLDVPPLGRVALSRSADTWRLRLA